MEKYQLRKIKHKINKRIDINNIYRIKINKNKISDEFYFSLKYSNYMFLEMQVELT